MELELDKRRFQRYMELNYGVSAKVITTVPKKISRSSHKIKKWVNAICKSLGCTVDEVFTKTRKKNKYYSIWARYVLSVHEGIHDEKLGELFGVSRTTIAYDRKVCRGWTEVYPDIYKGIIKSSKEFTKPRKYKYELLIKKTKL